MSKHLEDYPGIKLGSTHTKSKHSSGSKHSSTSKHSNSSKHSSTSKVSSTSSKTYKIQSKGGSTPINKTIEVKKSGKTKSLSGKSDSGKSYNIINKSVYHGSKSYAGTSQKDTNKKSATGSSIVTTLGNKKPRLTKLQFTALVNRDYKLIEPENYTKILKGAHIRYEYKDGTYYKGGYVHNHLYKNENGIKKHYIWVYSNEQEARAFRPRKKIIGGRFRLDVDKVAKIYERYETTADKKIDKKTKEIDMKIKDLTGQVDKYDKLVYYTKQLAEQVQILQKENREMKQRIYGLENNLSVLIDKLRKRLNPT